MPRNRLETQISKRAFPSALSCPTGKDYFGLCSAPYSTHKKEGRPPTRKLSFCGSPLMRARKRRFLRHAFVHASKEEG